MGNKFDEMRDAVAEAEQVLRAADSCATEMAGLLRGRLRKVGNVFALTELKRELQDFDAHRKEWKKMSLTEAEVEITRQGLLADAAVSRAQGDHHWSDERINALCDLALSQLRAQGQAVAATCFHRLTEGCVDDKGYAIKPGRYALYPDHLVLFAAPQPAQGMVTLPEVVLNSAISMLEVDGDEHNVAAFLRANIATLKERTE